MNRASIPISPLQVLQPLLARYGAACSLEEFHEAVNVAFHDAECEVYDQLHQDMWRSLPRQFELLTADLLGRDPLERPVRILDIGSGTGLSSELLIRQLGKERIQSIHLLDTSERMLEAAHARLAKSPIPVNSTAGTTEALIGDGKFDLILTCSVLHHIPDLEHFGMDISRLQAPGGIFMHLQDPNGDSAGDPRREERETTWKRRKKPVAVKRLERFLPHRVMSAIWRRVKRTRGGNYIDKMNRHLMDQGLIRRPMDETDIWAVTDIHVGNGQGVSIAVLRSFLPQYDLISSRSYGFYSVLASSLPADLRAEEERLIAAGCQEGSYLAAVWQKRKASVGN